jgi:hypothetical protein
MLAVFLIGPVGSVEYYTVLRNSAFNLFLDFLTEEVLLVSSLWYILLRYQRISLCLSVDIYTCVGMCV